MNGLLNAKQLRLRLGMPESSFFAQKKKGSFRQFEVARPIGHYRYSAALVEDFLAGRSIARFGAGARRAS